MNALYALPARGLLMLAVFLVSAASIAQAAERTAHEVISETTERVLEVIDEARGYATQDPDRYYTAVHQVLDPVVDYSGFARGVMGQYATGARYKSLDDAGRKKLRSQVDRFTETMRVGLIRTYSKGLLAFGGSRVELVEDESQQKNAKRAQLRQLIYSDAPEPYEVVYSMARNRNGDWQMRNLIVENINLGQIYRSQFESSARRFNGDLDQVIDNWSTDAAR
ncbi:MAG: ABC transporter substrate-binding protein [Pseudomonadota bacterium]